MNIQTLKQTARERLDSAPTDPRRLALLHTGAAVLLSLLATVINYLLSRQMADTGGLSGIPLRTALTFAQSMLLLATTVLMPFWEHGFTRAMLLVSRGEQAAPGDLLTGFRRFGVVLRLLLLQTVLTVAVTFACLQASAILFMLSPWSALTAETADALLASGAAIDEAAINQMMQTMYPMYLILAVLVGVLLVPLLYRFRLSNWAVMDDIPRARQAMRYSAYWMHKNRFRMFRLDLSFWWYYALLGIAATAAYGDLLLPLLGINLNADVAFFGSYLVSAAVQLAVAWRFAPYVQTTYALAYQTLRAEKPPIQTAPQPKPSPWEN